MFKLSKKQQHWLDFLFAMTAKEIKARYKFALLGFLWIVLNPVLQMLVIGLVFQFFFTVPVDNYFFYLLAGLLPWNFFSYTVSKSTTSIIFERSLIQKAKFPRESIVLSIVLANFFHFLIAMLLFIIVCYFFENIAITSILLCLPLFLWLLTITTGFSLLFSSLNVRYRDVSFFVQAIMPLWFYATPVVYTSSLLPSKFQFLLRLNPMTNIVELFQVLLVHSKSFSLSHTIATIFISIIFFLFSYIFFSRESKYFDDWI